MQVANLERCKELYELSGLSETEFYWSIYFEVGQEVTGEELLVHNTNHAINIDGYFRFPAYDLGFLLRKLPHEILEIPEPTTYEHYALRLGAETSGEWYANYWMFDYPRISLDGMEPSDTPEDAAASLAITLFKEGILTHEK